MFPKLILVEGIPGSGKSSTAQFIHILLDELHQPNQLYLEGDLDHPADYESVACLTGKDYDDLMASHTSDARWLEDYVVRKGEDLFFSYRKMNQAGCPDGLCSALARYEIYEWLSLSDFRRVTLEHWQEFATQAQTKPQTNIFECCFIQNPITGLRGHHNASEDETLAQIMEIAQAIDGLNPVLVYIDPVDVGRTLAKVSHERPPEWSQFVIDYITGQGFGLAQELVGFDGMVTFYEMMRRLSLEVIEHLAWHKLHLINSDGNWDMRRAELRGFIKDLGQEELNSE